MENGIYYGYIVKGDLRGAISYVQQFPDQIELYNRFMERFEQERYINYEVDSDLNDVLLAYQQYYRDTLYLGVGKDQAAELLRKRLLSLLGISDGQTALGDLEQNHLAELFQRRGLHFLGGLTSGYYGPYVWKTTETLSYDVELPNGVQSYCVKLLDGFITRSWIDFLSFGEIGSGGWADGDGYINCVKSAWDFDSESFRVSLLKHEAQHAYDLERSPDMLPEELEYRAKLVELIYSRERNLLQTFAQEADNSDKNNGHAIAAYRIMKGFEKVLGIELLDPLTVPVGTIQAVARSLFEKSKIEDPAAGLSA